MLKVLAKLKVSHRFFTIFCVLAILSFSLFYLAIEYGDLRDLLYYDEYVDPEFAFSHDQLFDEEGKNVKPRIKDRNEWLTKFVDPLIGTDGGGNVFPGPCLPFGVVKVGFDIDDAEDNNSGYGSRGKITGISHLHLSGTKGVPQYGLISQLPIVSPSIDEISLNDYGSSRSFETFK
ncbi:1366_t:CDS:2, partial [Acaulospora morrowiae]